jgi:hypothetical protein
MSTTIYIQSDQEASDVLHLVRTAIEAEAIRLELALEMANQRLMSFEKKYNVTSEYFISHLSAEDLTGGDDEYISWAGEYQLKQRLQKKLKQLREIQYDNSGIL